MHSKIEKYFQNSLFYRNYNEINRVVLKFQKIKDEYTESKNKNKLNNVSILLNKNQLQNKFLEKMNLILFDKFSPTNIEMKYAIYFKIKLILIK
jgi:hypothetical protein